MNENILHLFKCSCTAKYAYVFQRELFKIHLPPTFPPNNEHPKDFIELLNSHTIPFDAKWKKNVVNFSEISRNTECNLNFYKNIWMVGWVVWSDLFKQIQQIYPNVASWYMQKSSFNAMILRVSWVTYSLVCKTLSMQYMISLGDYLLLDMCSIVCRRCLNFKIRHELIFLLVYFSVFGRRSYHACGRGRGPGKVWFYVRNVGKGCEVYSAVNGASSTHCR